MARPVAAALARLNARHPWSHNDHFHPWILANLPERRRTALDVGCGRGELLAALASYVAVVDGADVDPTMRRLAARRCTGLASVTVHDEAWTDLPGPYDVITMVAVLHHLDVPVALRDVGRLLAPGGRFLAVGLAPPDGLRDRAWDLASAVSNPVIGWIKHPRPSTDGVTGPAFPVRDPTITFGALRRLLDEAMPGAELRHRLGFRHTIAWTRPA